jgi:hypothetical protein
VSKPGGSNAVISDWTRNRETVESLGLREKLISPGFKPIEFDRVKTEAGGDYFVLSPQRWIEAAGAIGIVSKSGRYGGAFARSDVAFEFASWISQEFKLYLMKQVQRLKEIENRLKDLNFSLPILLLYVRRA